MRAAVRASDAPAVGAHGVRYVRTVAICSVAVRHTAPRLVAVVRLPGWSAVHEGPLGDRRTRGSPISVKILGNAGIDFLGTVDGALTRVAARRQQARNSCQATSRPADYRHSVFDIRHEPHLRRQDATRRPVGPEIDTLVTSLLSRVDSGPAGEYLLGFMHSGGVGGRVAWPAPRRS